MAMGPQLTLSKVTVFYAENGRGKTTLTAIMRSLSLNDPTHIACRRRLGVADEPHIALGCTIGINPAPVLFQNNTWSLAPLSFAIFDDHFVEENICSGLSVVADQRQNLHELVLGAQGVILSKQVDAAIKKVEDHNQALRAKSAAITSAIRGGYTVDQFCSLPEVVDIDDKLKANRQALVAAQRQGEVAARPGIIPIPIPAIDRDALAKVLALSIESLDAQAVEEVRKHFELLGRGAETWIREGIHRFEASSSQRKCPFCTQSIESVFIVDHYRRYFSEAYQRLGAQLSEMIQTFSRQHSPDAINSFERSIETVRLGQQFWSQFCDVEPFEVDVIGLRSKRERARDAIANEFRNKQADPLTSMAMSLDTLNALDEYEEAFKQIEVINGAIQAATQRISAVKAQAAAANPAVIAREIERLEAVKRRYSPESAPLCKAYQDESTAKMHTEANRDSARAALVTYRRTVFPSFQGRLNHYLMQFGAGFSLKTIEPGDSRAGAVCNYTVLINNVGVPVAGGTPSPDKPSFKNTLSGGDRNTLALAFFLASLDLDPNLGSKIVVIDDPLSSLDEHRTLTTIQELRKLVPRVRQLLVLSHNKQFLCGFWEGLGNLKGTSAAFKIHALPGGSNIEVWNVNEDAITENDRRRALIDEYLQGRAFDRERDVAAALRPCLEAYHRVITPQEFPPESLLGKFADKCRQRLGNANQILNATDLQELHDLLEYANKFHHDSNPNWQTCAINSGELEAFTRRTLKYCGK